MLKSNLRKEYELRHRIALYKKLYKLYLYNKFEINNYKIVEKTLEDLALSFN